MFDPWFARIRRGQVHVDLHREMGCQPETRVVGEGTFLDVEDVEEDTVTLHCVWRTTNENPALAALLARVAA